jgi:hypothetical protein
MIGLSGGEICFLKGRYQGREHTILEVGASENDDILFNSNELC